MKNSHRKLEQQLKALANHRRLEIIAYLKKKRTGIVTDIAKDIGIRIEATSQHLRILKAAGIVEYVKRGRFSAYRLSLHQTEPAKKVLGML
tara:strand:- start:1117 stop:1389 length:273 start_codon:yes stop_codon:yes gene_type:complete